MTGFSPVRVRAAVERVATALRFGALLGLNIRLFR